MLTDEQLEKAARYLCEKYRLDPEETDGAQFDGPGWKNYEEAFADEIRAHELLHEAMDFARPDSMTIPKPSRVRYDGSTRVATIQQEGTGNGV